MTADDLIADDDATPLDHRVMGLAHVPDDATRRRVESGVADVHG